jgi:arylsulfatase A-like enzyme
VASFDKDTLVFFLSDDGCPVMTGAGTNGPLNGEKMTYYEGGIRVPFIAYWPGRVPAGSVYREPVVSRDIVPTFLSAAEARPGDGDFDGVDLLKLHQKGLARFERHETGGRLILPLHSRCGLSPRLKQSKLSACPRHPW